MANVRNIAISKNSDFWIHNCHISNFKFGCTKWVQMRIQEDVVRIINRIHFGAMKVYFTEGILCAGKFTALEKN